MLHEPKRHIISDVAIRKYESSFHILEVSKYLSALAEPQTANDVIGFNCMFVEMRNLYASHFSYRYFSGVLFIVQLVIDLNFALSVNLVTQNLLDVNICALCLKSGRNPPGYRENATRSKSPSCSEIPRRRPRMSWLEPFLSQ